MTCRPDLRLPGWWRSTRPPITATSRKARFNRLDPCTHSTNSSSNMSAEKSDAGSVDRIEPVAGERIIVGDEAQWPQPRALHPPGDQHAERLVRVPAFEAVGDHVVAMLVREGLDEQLVGRGQFGAIILHLEPVAHVVGEARPLRRGRGGSGGPGRRGWSTSPCARRDRSGFAPISCSPGRSGPCRRSSRPRAPGRRSRRCRRRQGRGEIVLDRAELAAAAEADVVERHVDDDAGVHPVLLDEARVARPARVPSGPRGSAA